MIIRRNVGERFCTSSNLNIYIGFDKNSNNKTIEFINDNGPSLDDFNEIIQWATMSNESPKLHCEECGAKQQTIFTFNVSWKDGTSSEVTGRSSNGNNIVALNSALAAMHKSIDDVIEWKLLG